MGNKKPRVLCGTPNYQNSYAAEVYASHMLCSRKWQEWGIDFQFMVAGRNFVHFARTQISQAFMNAEEWTHLLWLDDDALIEPEVLPKMLEHKEQVVIAPYPMRRSPFEIGILIATHWSCPKCGADVYSDESLPALANGITCKCGTEMFRDYHDHKSYRNLDIPDLDCGLQEVDGGGTHCMLVEKSAYLQKSDKPPEAQVDQKLLKIREKLTVDECQHLEHYQGSIPTINLSFMEEDDLGYSYFVMPKSGTEDMLWCYRAKQKDIKIHADTDIFADHVGFAPVITREFRENLREIQTGVRPNTGGHAFIDVKKGRDHTKIFKDREVSLV